MAYQWSELAKKSQLDQLNKKVDDLETDIAEGNVVIAQATNASHATNASNATKVQNVDLSSSAVAKFGDYTVSKLKPIYSSTSGATSYKFTSYPKKMLVYFGTNAGGVEEGESLVIFLPNSSFDQYSCERLINVSGSDVFKIYANIHQNSLSITRMKNTSVLYTYNIYEIYEVIE